MVGVFVIEYDNGNTPRFHGFVQSKTFGIVSGGREGKLRRGQEGGIPTRVDVKVRVHFAAPFSSNLNKIALSMVLNVPTGIQLKFQEFAARRSGFGKHGIENIGALRGWEHYVWERFCWTNSFQKS